MSDLPPSTLGTPGVGPAGFSSLPPANPRDQVNLPAIFLIIVGAIGAAWKILVILLNALGVGLNAAGGGNNAMAGMMQGTIGIVFGVIGIIVAGVIIFGGIKMKKLQSYGLALTAAIIAMIPCISPCCILGLPFGIWALIVLMKPEVKAAFGTGGTGLPTV